MTQAVSEPDPEAPSAGRSPSVLPRPALLVGYAFAIIGAVLFSTKAVAVKLVYAQGLDAETLLALRMGVSLPVYLAMGAATFIRDRRSIPLEGPLLVRAALIGILGYWLASYTDFLGLQSISATFGRLILFTYPLFVVLLGAAFFGGRLTWRAVAAFAVSYAGLALIFLQHPTEPGANATLGALLVLVAALAFGLYQLLAKAPIARLGSSFFTTVAMSSAALTALAVFALSHPLSALAAPAPAWPGILFLAFGATIIPSYFLNAALARISAQANGVIGMVSPIATIIFAALFLGESLTPVEWGGTVLVLGGVAAFVLGDRRR